MLWIELRWLNPERFARHISEGAEIVWLAARAMENRLKILIDHLLLFSLIHHLPSFAGRWEM